jgi:hypothetical protein
VTVPRRRLLVAVAAVLCGLLLKTAPGLGADLGPEPQPAPALSQWQFSFTPYGWLPWLTGNMVVRGRAFDVNVDPVDIIDHLDWSTLPLWMSYAEARRGRLSLFNDIVYAKLSGSGGFTVDHPLIQVRGRVEADYQLAIVEAGGAYEVWGHGIQGSTGSTAFDLLAGARYWHQEANISVGVTVVGLSDPPGISISRSGSVDWVDPFIGARVRHQLAPSQEIVLRGDVGGFGAGSQFSWQAIGTYNWLLCVTHGIPVDGYVGFRALSADYSQGSGTSKFEFDNVI